MSGAPAYGLTSPAGTAAFRPSTARADTTTAFLARSHLEDREAVAGLSTPSRQRRALPPRRRAHRQEVAVAVAAPMPSRSRWPLASRLGARQGRVLASSPRIPASPDPSAAPVSPALGEPSARPSARSRCQLVPVRCSRGPRPSHFPSRDGSAFAASFLQYSESVWGFPELRLRAC
jgi:hypothetical protein